MIRSVSTFWRVRGGVGGEYVLESAGGWLVCHGHVAALETTRGQQCRQPMDYRYLRKQGGCRGEGRNWVMGLKNVVEGWRGGRQTH